MRLRNIIIFASLILLLNTSLAAGQMQCGPLAAGQMQCGPLSTGQMQSGPLAAGQMICGPLATGQMQSGPLATGQMVCEVPVFVSTAVPPNIMIIADNSGSMNRAIYHSDYDPATIYSGNFTGRWHPFRASTHRTIAVTRNGRTAYLLHGPGDDGHGVRYTTNYLNWIFWHADATQRQNLPQQTRIQAARDAISAVVKNTAGVRFGLMKFNHSEGGRVVAPIGGITPDNIDTYLHTVRAVTWTPLAETLLESWFYFQGAPKCYGGSGTHTSPIQYWCQRSFVILVSDGKPARDKLNKSCAIFYRQNWDGDDEYEKERFDFLAYGYKFLNDIAYYMYNNDARDDLYGKQNIVTYTIGFTLTGWGADLLKDTAIKGGGQYFDAWNVQELTEAMQGAIFDILRQVSAGAAVAVLSTAYEGDDRLVRAKFLPEEWKGYLEAFSIPYSTGDSPLWEAGLLLKNRPATDRTIFTLHNGIRTDFAVTSANLKTHLSGLWGVNEDEAADIINYIRGDATYEGAKFRDRDGWKLGTIVHSAPVIVGPPAYHHTENDYRDFKDANKDREKMVYVGANDGMLHAFRLRDGKELWAYIPSNLWGNLKHLADHEYCHVYYVDLTPKVTDIFDGTNWKTVLIGGQRGGGGTYFALDITDPNNPKILWEFAHEDLGETWSIPATGRVKIGGYDRWVAFVGSGFENEDTKGYLFAIDINTGSILWSSEEVSYDTGNRLTSPTAIDTDDDGDIDTVYAGDLKGKIWRFDVSKYDEDDWSHSLLFHAVDAAGNSQPITVRPVVSFDLDLNPVIYFGTGKFYTDADKFTTQQQSFYGIIDDGSGITITRADLADQTTIIRCLEGRKGWHIDLSVSSPSERVISEAAVVAGVVFFTSFIPVDDPCAHGGLSYLWAVEYLTGRAPDEPVLTPEEGEILEKMERRMRLPGGGIPPAPVVSIKHEKVVVHTGDATIHIEAVHLPDLGVRFRFWREVF